MKRFTVIALLLAFLLCGCSQEIVIDHTTIVTQTGTVTDHAMASEGRGKIWDNSYPYIGIELEDGTGICVWNKKDVANTVEIGDTVEVTYGLQEGTDHWILIEIKEVP